VLGEHDLKMLVSRDKKRDCLQRAMTLTSHYRHIVCVPVVVAGHADDNAIVLDFVTTPASLAMVPSGSGDGAATAAAAGN
jgi:hypothetical protein